MILSYTEENYLKALLKIAQVHPEGAVGTNELALHLQVRPASVNDMLKKLREKNLVDYRRYGKIQLTELGRQYAVDMVRKHRLWETFLYEKLEFTWDEVHDLAEQLEHIQSDVLIDKLDRFLGYPKHDPHGDPIPVANDTELPYFKRSLAGIRVGETCWVASVDDTDNAMLNRAQQLGLQINTAIQMVDKPNWDDVVVIAIDHQQHTVGHRFADRIFVLCSACQSGAACSYENPCR
ncbi:MAG TPA: metal-dependent transcriptional regulator [Luteibaculaceae bacterium]|nr:metal-dependent transcriptional regulator [Luteibaculaceae bacterium]